MPLAHLLNHVLEFCYPSTCAHCESPALPGQFLCDACSQNLDDLSTAHACERCAMPLPMPGPCPHCLDKGLTPLDRIVRLGIFKEPLKDLIHHMKYHRRWTLGEQLADRLSNLDRVKTLITSDTVLVPVPLHIRRHISRGYNQSDIIARQLRKHFHCKLAHPARRIRHTFTQTHIHAKADREANVRGAFALNRRADLANRPIVIIDDVITTGSTLRSLARTIKLARPQSISAIVLAIADPHHQDFQKI